MLSFYAGCSTFLLVSLRYHSVMCVDLDIVMEGLYLTVGLTHMMHYMRDRHLLSTLFVWLQLVCGMAEVGQLSSIP
jgi:hypothetical protein